jgi:glycosyltransferase involved in cell wall biosynthesis
MTNNTKKKRIFFVHNALQTFVRIDRDLLSEVHDVIEINFSWGAGSLMKVLKEIAKCEAVFGWFASHHTFLPALLGKLLRKKVIICASDYDLANEPEWNYGSMRGGMRKLVNNWIFESANAVIVPSQYSKTLALKNTVLKRNRHKVKIVPHGLPFQSKPKIQKEQSVLTIGFVNDETLWRKGIGTFVEMARHIPGIPCNVVGKLEVSDHQGFVSRANPNVIFHGFLPDHDRDRLLASAGAYAQLSYMEGFGLALAEAMLQECVPVVTDRAALPEVVGDCGIYVPYDNPKAAAEGVREALSKPDLGKRARERILDLFPLEKRKEAILQLLGDESCAG